ncbi:hypothetical protein [Bdellovibrio sp. BCCA]|uniref:hypothetical protein n=1 Tax=Bdellovibrio sp. BCCA TaxID=3136281 RepID=UPI0030F12726
MKKLLLALIGTMILTLSACTSKEGKLKKQAEEIGKAKFMEVLKKEADDGLGQSDWLRQAYVEYVGNRSEVEAENVNFIGETAATATLVVKTYSPKMRQTLISIAAKVDPDKARRFNFGEALVLIRRQTGQNTETDYQPLTVLKFTKSGEKWVADNP